MRSRQGLQLLLALVLCHHAAHAQWTLFTSNSATTPPVKKERNHDASCDGSQNGDKVHVKGISKKNGRPAEGESAAYPTGWVFRARVGAKYVHMPTIAYSKDRGEIFVAWQGAKVAEGNGDQTVMYTVSKDGGKKWGPGKRLPGSSKSQEGRWAPVLFQPPGKHVPMHLFYAQSRTCVMQRRGGSRQWRPGGDIMMTTTRDGQLWTHAKVIYKETEHGPIPKVIANPPVVVGSHWVMPFWRERPRGPAECKPRGQDFAGVLSTPDEGKTWRAQGRIVQTSGKRPPSNMGKPDWLIEAAAVHLGGSRVKQFFRTSRDVMYSSLSEDGGKTWHDPRPAGVPNANAKITATRLSNGALVLVYNHHKYKQYHRTNLFVAISYDEGHRWKELAQLEVMDKPLHYFHYPSVIQVGCRIYVVYAVHGQGIKMADIEIEFRSGH